jgi:hypothetical protein
MAQVVKASRPHAFLWNPGQPLIFGTMVDLGDLPDGADQSIAHGINSRGQVVGEGSVASGPHAFLVVTDVAKRDQRRDD